MYKCSSATAFHFPLVVVLKSELRASYMLGKHPVTAMSHAQGALNNALYRESFGSSTYFYFKASFQLASYWL